MFRTGGVFTKRVERVIKRIQPGIKVSPMALTALVLSRLWF